MDERWLLTAIGMAPRAYFDKKTALLQQQRLQGASGWIVKIQRQVLRDGNWVNEEEK